MNNIKRLCNLGLLARRSFQAQSHIEKIPYSAILRNNYSTEAPVQELSEDLRLTDACVRQLKIISLNGEFLRVAVEGGGCSGFSYKIFLDNEKEADDKTFSRDGVEVVVDSDSLELIKGSYIDYEVELIKSAFQVTSNPQSKKGCSCGVSFSID